MQPQKEQRVERRLAAIFAADVAAYSRLMSQDEAGTLRALAAAREIMDGLIAEHGGRIANTAGDSVLAEFPSAVDAVQCAVAVQERPEANAGTPEDRRIQFRIGVHVGDVVVRGGDLLGDGVNVAARLEGLAEAGGIAISAAAHDYVRKALRLVYTDLGEQQVKGFAEPVRAYAVRSAVSAVESATPRPLPLPDKPSIAVLPFTNMSSDPEQEYFADGVVEDIITALSRVKWFFVIARNSSFAYKGRAVDVKQVGRELGVRYVLEGSIRKAASRVRITGQLVDAETGHHVWADRYDGGLADIFDLQDEITQKVVAAIEPHVFAAERSRSDRKPPKSLRAWDHVMRAMPCVWAWAETDSEVALQELQRAIHIDPHYGHAHSLLAWTYMARTHMGWSQLAEALEPAKDAARTAMNQDADDPWAHLAVGYLHMVTRRYREAIAALQELVRRNPSFALGHAVLGCAYACAGGGDKGLEHVRLATRLSPRDPQNAFFLSIEGLCHFVEQRYDESAELNRRAIQQKPTHAGALRSLAAACVKLGAMDDARRFVGEALKIQPGLSARWLEANHPLALPEHRLIYIAALRLAGLPE